MSDANVPTAPAPPSEAEWLGHPRGLFYLFFAEMWERFCYYGMRAILVLYMTNYFMYTDDVASGIYGAYTGLVYCVALFGGAIADRILGYRPSIVLGGVLMAIGEFLLVLNREILGMPESLESTLFFAGLATIIVGNGFFKPNISSIVGKLYREGDPRRDAGFTIFYMGINVGALAGGLLCGWIGEKVSWTWGFALAGLGMLLGLVAFQSGRQHLAGKGEPKDPEAARRKFPLVLLGALAFVPVFAYVLEHNEIMRWVLYPLFVGMMVWLVAVALKEDVVQRERIYALLVLMFFNVAFWMFFEQAGNSLTLFAERNVDRLIGSWEMPASWVQQFNPTFIILLAPVFTWLWTTLGRKGKEPSIPTKFALGMAQIAAAFGVLVLGAKMFARDGMTPLTFMVLLYLLQTTGELCLSPVGLSMVTKLAPQRMTGMVMGGWFLSIAVANYLAGEIGKLTKEAGGSGGQALPPTESLPIYVNVYQQGALVLAACAVVLFLMIPLLRKWMHGVK